MCKQPMCEACAGASAHSVCPEQRSSWQKKHFGPEEVEQDRIERQDAHYDVYGV